MNKSEQSELSKKINNEIEATEKKIQSLEELIKPVSPDNALGRLTRLDAIGSKSINEAALGQARDKLNKLRYAQANLSKPGFGICSECEEKIPFARILIMPESIYCVSCTEDMENT